MATKSKKQETALREAHRKLKLEELRLRSAALAFSIGLCSQSEMEQAALAYGHTAREYKSVERDILDETAGILYTPDEVETTR
jgi:hypothetical protein